MILGVGAGIGFGQRVNKVPQIVVFDNFNRADSTTSLGTSTSGHQWLQAGTRVHGISSNQGYMSGGSGSYMPAYIPIQFSDYTISVKFTVQGATSYAQLYCRYTDNANFVALRTFNGKYQLVRFSSGVSTVLIDSLIDSANGDIVALECKADGTIKAYINNVLMGTVVDNVIPVGSNNNVGVSVFNSTARFDDFTVTA